MNNSQKTLRCCNHILQLNENQPTCGNLYLGSVGSLKEQIISALKINAVLTLMDQYFYHKKQIDGTIKKLNIKNHKWIDLADEQDSDIEKNFDQCFQFIDQCLKQCNVLVHCQAGISRSATIVIFYVMKKLNISLQLANKLVVSKRYIVSPNEGFWKSLENEELKLKKIQSTKQNDSNIANIQKGRILDPFSKYSNEPYPQKFVNHIVCLSQDSCLDKGNLFLGQFSILKSHFLKDLKIKAIISVVQESYYKRMKVRQIIEHEGINNYLWLNIKDQPKESLDKHFDQTFNFINQHLKQGNVLVHCQAGVSRSASIVIAFIIKYFRVGYEQALNFVKSKRKVVKPNSGFELFLIQYSQKQITK